MEQFGADTIRWYLLAISNPWVPKRFDPEGVKEVQRKVFDTLRNTYRFLRFTAILKGGRPASQIPLPRSARSSTAGSCRVLPR